MLSGEYRHNCDEKFRLRLPAKFKKELDDGYVVTGASDGCLFVFSGYELKNLLEKTEKVPLFDNNLQKPLRMLYSSAYEVEEDSQGRFLLPAALREFAGIKKEVVFVGVGNRAEIWSSERWDNYSKNLSGNFDAVLSELGKYGI